MFNVQLFISVAKLLDLDLTSGTATDENKSELSLHVDLQHFGAVSTFFFKHLPTKMAPSMYNGYAFFNTLICLTNTKLMNEFLIGL